MSELPVGFGRSSSYISEIAQKNSHSPPENVKDRRRLLRRVVDQRKKEIAQKVVITKLGINVKVLVKSS